MSGNKKGVDLYLNPNELKFLALAVIGTYEQIREGATDKSISWNNTTKKDLKEMLAAGGSLRIKLERLGFNMDDMPPYKPGDENEFLNQQQ